MIGSLTLICANADMVSAAEFTKILCLLQPVPRETQL